MLGKVIETTNQIIQKAKSDGVTGIEPDSTWESMYDFDKVVLMNTRLKVYYRKNDGRGWSNEVDEVNLTQDRNNNYGDAKWMLSWVRRSIRKGYTDERRMDKRQQKLDNKEMQMNSNGVNELFGFGGNKETPEQTELVNKIKEMTQQMVEANPEDVVFAGGSPEKQIETLTKQAQENKFRGQLRFVQSPRDDRTYLQYVPVKSAFQNLAAGAAAGTY